MQQIRYVSAVQLAFLRLLSTRAAQTLTYLCDGGTAWFDASTQSRDAAVQLLGDNEFEFKTRNFMARRVQDGCQVRMVESYLLLSRSEVATAHSPYSSLKHFIFPRSYLLHVLLHHFQTPLLWSSPFSFSWQPHLLHLSSHIVNVQAFHKTFSALAAQTFCQNLAAFNVSLLIDVLSLVLHCLATSPVLLEQSFLTRCSLKRRFVRGKCKGALLPVCLSMDENRRRFNRKNCDENVKMDDEGIKTIEEDQDRTSHKN